MLAWCTSYPCRCRKCHSDTRRLIGSTTANYAAAVMASSSYRLCTTRLLLRLPKQAGCRHPGSTTANAATVVMFYWGGLCTSADHDAADIAKTGRRTTANPTCLRGPPCRPLPSPCAPPRNPSPPGWGSHSPATHQPNSVPPQNHLLQQAARPVLQST